MGRLIALVERFPEGYSQVTFQGRRWGLTKTKFNRGHSLKLFAEQLGGSDFVSCNFYRTGTGWRGKPCEMPMEKIEQFLSGLSMRIGPELVLEIE